MARLLVSVTSVLSVICVVLAVKDGQEFREPQEVDQSAQQNGVWPLQGPFGDVSALTIHPNGELFLLHRGPNTWREETFNESNYYQEFENGPISEDVLIGVDAETGEQRHRWGRDRFFMPHGLFIDNSKNFWITDVALHQVFKVNPSTLGVVMALGEPGVPGSGQDHFCKPTDVVVASNGHIFVADGYCNSRIVHFSPDGKYISEFGRAADAGVFPPAVDALTVPHSLAYIPRHDAVCVANREGQRIQCFSAGTQDGVPAGRFISQFAHSSLSRVFGITYNEKLNKIYAVNGVGFSLEDKPLEVFSIDLASNTMRAWNPASQGVDFVAPHDIAVSADGQDIFVADMASRPRIWKFKNGDAQQH